MNYMHIQLMHEIFTAVSCCFLYPGPAPSSPTVSLPVISHIPVDLRRGLSAHLTFKEQYFWRHVCYLIICEKIYSLFLLSANFYWEKPDADLPKAKSENIKACQMAMLLMEGAIWKPLCVCTVFLIYYFCEPKE